MATTGADQTDNVLVLVELYRPAKAALKRKPGSWSPRTLADALTCMDIWQTVHEMRKGARAVSGAGGL